MSTTPLSSLLTQGLKQLDLPSNITDKLMAYTQLLKQWNNVYNLTAIKDDKQIITKNLLDSLSIHTYLEENYCLDLGSGAGLPGIPLAIALPQKHFILLDSNQKKCLFLNQVKIDLSLDNITVVHSRAQQYQPSGLFDIIITRAFANLENMISCSEHLLKPRGYWLAMKAQKWATELTPISDKFTVNAQTITVPNLKASRHLICCYRKPTG